MAKKSKRDFGADLSEAFGKQFDIEVETNFDLLGCMRHVTTRKDGKRFTKIQCSFIRGFEAAWTEGK